MKTGWRKVIIFTEALVSFTVLMIVLQLKDAAAIMSLAVGITALLGSAIYGNVKEHSAKQEQKPQ